MRPDEAAELINVIANSLESHPDQFTLSVRVIGTQVAATGDGPGLTVTTTGGGPGSTTTVVGQFVCKAPQTAYRPGAPRR